MEGKDIEKIIDSLEEQKSKLRKELDKVEAAIEALQKVCVHQMEWVGNDSHKDHYKCEFCGETNSI